MSVLACDNTLIIQSGLYENGFHRVSLNNVTLSIPFKKILKCSSSHTQPASYVHISFNNYYTLHVSTPYVTFDIVNAGNNTYTCNAP